MNKLEFHKEEYDRAKQLYDEAFKKYQDAKLNLKIAELSKELAAKQLVKEREDDYRRS